MSVLQMGCELDGMAIGLVELGGGAPGEAAGGVDASLTRASGKGKGRGKGKARTRAGAMHPQAGISLTTFARRLLH